MLGSDLLKKVLTGLEEANLVVCGMSLEHLKTKEFYLLEDYCRVIIKTKIDNDRKEAISQEINEEILRCLEEFIVALGEAYETDPLRLVEKTKIIVLEELSKAGLD